MVSRDNLVLDDFITQFLKKIVDIVLEHHSVNRAIENCDRNADIFDWDRWRSGLSVDFVICICTVVKFTEISTIFDALTPVNSATISRA